MSGIALSFDCLKAEIFWIVVSIQGKNDIGYINSGISHCKRLNWFEVLLLDLVLRFAITTSIVVFKEINQLIAIRLKSQVKMSSLLEPRKT